ncbi:phage holin family protein [Clostridium beijerinckii]|uniref:phage holin family protein n=1 Tax=Clostridium beijerinckii TaxID=1520 RepID=UPI00098CD245|nr:phage holin family protein [Clostridium beijerinckii]MBA8937716.1 toxin secretion/phage lysis holin [Clostridium beijerinckii]NSA95112.1 toxin secretion/phage lysis holin [Clostridium beijerinckii]OOM49408.1 holin family protein [Clostridium beijerinckii]OOM66988.1 holin family protein [Clostridium beijerinckii]CUU51213.1 Toxin secretion/phage lysis holin [Clostridium beijerinckii]
MRFEKFLTLIGIVGGGISMAFGGWTTATTTLLIFMCIDYVTGFIVALIFKNSPKTDTGGLSSKVGYKGLAKKVMILLFLLIGYRLDLTLNTSYIKDGICIAFIVNELVSITENATLMGFPTPTIITNAIDILKQRSTKTDDTNIIDN